MAQAEDSHHARSLLSQYTGRWELPHALLSAPLHPPFTRMNAAWCYMQTLGEFQPTFCILTTRYDDQQKHVCVMLPSIEHDRIDKVGRAYTAAQCHGRSW